MFKKIDDCDRNLNQNDYWTVHEDEEFSERYIFIWDAFGRRVLYTIEQIKIAIRGDGKSPDQKVIDMQLQAANLVYIFDVTILSVTANKSGRLTVETSFLPLNPQASSYKVHSREITYKSSKGEQQFLNARHPLDLLYIYTIYYQNISKDIKVIERTSFPL